MNQDKALVVFQDKKIRRIWHNDEWYFSVVNVISALTESVDAKDYWYRLKKREAELGVELSTICRQLKLPASDGKKYATDCANTEAMFRIIQSIPSKKAEPFKIWLAKVGYERIKEIENPELAQDRARKYYEAKGYSKDWIEMRLRSIDVRQGLTKEWKQRDVKEGKEFAILTNEINKATFGITPKQHKQFKGLEPKKKNQNLRDHMTNLELVFTMLGEASTTEIAKSKDTQGFKENKQAAQEGGEIAGNARQELERKTKRKVVSRKNHLELTGKMKQVE